MVDSAQLEWRRARTAGHSHLDLARSAMADVRFEYATRRFPGTDRPAVDALDVHVQDGELLVLVGPSGSGKSTALRMLAGLEEVDEGGIWLGERDVT